MDGEGGHLGTNPFAVDVLTIEVISYPVHSLIPVFVQVRPDQLSALTSCSSGYPCFLNILEEPEMIPQLCVLLPFSELLSDLYTPLPFLTSNGHCSVHSLLLQD